MLLGHFEMSLEQQACEDLKAFERRLTEVIACLQPSTLRWRIILALAFASVSVGAWFWLADERTAVVPLVDSLINHPLFTLSSVVLLVLFLTGVHKKVIAAQIIASRARSVLSDFNLSIDDSGKLILKQRPNT